MESTIPVCLFYLLTLLKGWGYPISMLNSFQLTLFYKYAELLQRRFSDDFQEVCYYKIPQI